VVDEPAPAGAGDGAGAGDDLSTLTELRQRGVIDDAEFQTMKARVAPT
jgi:hypothetical protein